MHLRRIIEQLGYKTNEVRVYLASLQLGAATISEIAGAVKLPRTTVQLIIEHLESNAMMNFFIKKRRRYWIAENPERLLISLKERETALREVMPELQGLRRETGVTPTVRSFSGSDGIQRILDDIIESKHHIASITSMEDFLQLIGEDFNDFVKRRYNRFLQIRLLTNRSQETEALKKRDAQELRQTRFLPKTCAVHNANFIYGDKVAIISLNKKHPVGITIEDKDIAETQLILFESLWQQSSEF